MLGFPEISGDRMNGQPLWAAVAIAPDFGQDARFTDKRIVIGDSAVIVQAHNNTLMVTPILSRMRHQGVTISHRWRHAITQGQEHVALAIKDQLTAVMTEAHCLRRKQFDHVGQAIVLQPPANDCRRRAISYRLGKSQIYPLIVAVVGVRNYIKQPALALIEDLRCAGYGFGQQLTVTDQAQTSRLFRDQHIAVRQPRH